MNEMVSPHVSQAGPELLYSSDLSASASQVAGSTGMCYIWLTFYICVHTCPSYRVKCKLLHLFYI